MINLNQLETVLLKADFLEEQSKALNKLKQRIQENEITVSVMGQFKRGKSSLINCLLAEDLLPTAVIPVTTIITEIRYGDTTSAQVCYTDGRTMDIALSQIDDFCSEEKNPGNRKNVETLKLFTPHHPFGRSVVLSDTPGVGSVNASNTDSAYRYIRHSDVILFLLSVDSPVSETERDFLLESRDFAQKFFFAINKCDLIDSDDLQEFKTYCIKTLSEYLESSVKIATISAKTGQGVSDLQENIGRILNEQHSEILESSANSKAEIIISQARAKLELQLRAAASPPADLRRKLLVVEEKQKQTGNFADDLQIISKTRSEKLITHIEAIMDAECAQIHKALTQTGLSLYQKSNTLKARAFEEYLSRELNKFLTCKLESLNTLGLQTLEYGYTQITEALQSKTLETSMVLQNLMRQELGVNYPVRDMEFSVSEKSDFIMHIGFDLPMLPDFNSLNCLLPKKTANRRFYKRALQQAEKDIKKNRNNMIYNYRYKMQESLRPLCLSLTEENKHVEAELENLKNQIGVTLTMAETRRQLESDNVKHILSELEMLK